MRLGWSRQSQTSDMWANGCLNPDIYLRICCRKTINNSYVSLIIYPNSVSNLHDDVIIWKHFPHYWPFVPGIHRSPVNSPHKGQWRGALMFSLICARINSWINNREAGDLRHHRAHYDVIVMYAYAFSLRLQKRIDRVFAYENIWLVPGRYVMNDMSPLFIASFITSWRHAISGTYTLYMTST